MTRVGRQRLGYFVAPLVPTVAVFSLIGGMPMVSMQPLLFLTVVYFVSFLVMCVFALPLLAFCFKKRRLLDCVLAGTVTGLVVAAGLVLFGGRPFSEMLEFEQLVTVVLFLATALGSVVFWLVAYREPNQSKKAPASQAGTH